MDSYVQIAKLYNYIYGNSDIKFNENCNYLINAYNKTVKLWNINTL